MSINHKCPRCGSEYVQLTDEKSKHGCFWFLVFGALYVGWTMCKWVIGLLIFLLYDWWMAIIKACNNKGHVWQCRKWFAFTKRTYYCHDCGYNFKA